MRAATGQPDARHVDESRHGDDQPHGLRPDGPARRHSDRDRVARALALDDGCLSHHGKNVFEIDMPSEKACPNNAEWRKTTMWWLLVSDPVALGRAALRVPSLLLPWLPQKLGFVEGETYAGLPPSAPSIASLIGTSPTAAGALLLTPWLVLADVLHAPRLAACTCVRADVRRRLQQRLRGRAARRRHGRLPQACPACAEPLHSVRC